MTGYSSQIEVCWFTLCEPSFRITGDNNKSITGHMLLFNWDILVNIRCDRHRKYPKVL